MATTGTWSDALGPRFLGKSLAYAGVDAGIVRNSASQVEGFNGGWSATSAQYNNINTTGQLAMKVGSSAQMYSVYLRRDGTLPMTGNLDLDGNNINGVNTITVTGIVVQGAVCPTTGVIARSNTGAVMSCQSGAWQPQGSNYWKDPVANAASLPACNSSVYWQTRIVQNPSVGSGPRAYTCSTTGWQPLGLADNGNFTIPGILNVDGNTVLDGNLRTNGTTTLVGNTTMNGNMSVAGTSTLSGNLSVAGTASLNGNTNMGSASSVNTVRGTTTVTGNTTFQENVALGNATDDVVKIGVVVTEGASCSGGNGAMARTSAGLVLSCQSGAWKKASIGKVAIDDMEKCQGLGNNYTPYVSTGSTTPSGTTVKRDSGTILICMAGEWVIVRYPSAGD